MKRLPLTVALSLCLCLQGAAASAQAEKPRVKTGTGEGGRGGRTADPKTEAALAKSCKDEIEKFCNGVEQGPKLGKCLLENEGELSAGCGRTLKSLPQPAHKGGADRTVKTGSSERAAEAGLTKACAGDIARFCKGAKGGPQQGRCLMNNESGLSEGCAIALKEMPPPAQQGGAGTTSAAGQKAESELMAACRDDINKYCRGVEPGRQQGNCLKENEAKLAAGCSGALKTLPPPEQEAGAALTKACSGDIEKFCKGIGPGMMQGNCLKENENRLSAECGKTLRSMPPPSQESGELLIKSCREDINKFCAGIGPGPQQGQCLMENQDKLSPGCSKTLKSLPPPGEGGPGGEGGPEGSGGPGEPGGRE